MSDPIIFIKGVRYENPEHIFLSYTADSDTEIINADVDGDGRISLYEVSNIDTFVQLGNRQDVKVVIKAEPMSARATLKAFWPRPIVYLGAGVASVIFAPEFFLVVGGLMLFDFSVELFGDAYATRALQKAYQY